jgi:hypothetical protein
MAIDNSLLEILACPKCKGELDYKNDKLICASCKLAYPVKEDIPIMLIDQAERIDG